MGVKWEKILSKAIGVKPIMINSSLVSAQNRQRLYWTNIGLEPQGLFGDLESTIQQPKDKGILLKDILETEVDAKYYLSDKLIKWLEKHSLKRGNPFKKKTGEDKSCCLTSSGLSKTNLSTDYIVYSNKIRRLTPIECERLQTVKDNYTNYVSDSQRYKMLGNGWTVDVIAHILNYIK